MTCGGLRDSPRTRPGATCDMFFTLRDSSLYTTSWLYQNLCGKLWISLDVWNIIGCWFYITALEQGASLLWLIYVYIVLGPWLQSSQLINVSTNASNVMTAIWRKYSTRSHTLKTGGTIRWWWLMVSRQLYRLQDRWDQYTFFWFGKYLMELWRIPQDVDLVAFVDNVKNMLKMHRFLMNGPDS